MLRKNSWRMSSRRGSGGWLARRSWVALGAVLASLLASAVPARATTIGPDAFGYTATDQEPFSFVDISTTGTRVLAGSAEGTYFASIGFTFKFYGTGHPTAYHYTNDTLLLS